MKRFFALLFVLLVAGPASAGVYQEICYNEPSICAKIVDHSGFLSQIAVKKSDWGRVNQELSQVFWRNGITFQVVSDARYNSLTAPTIRRYNASSDADLIDGMSDEEFDMTMNTLSCLGAAVGCAGGIAGSVSSGGAALFFAGMACGFAPVSCLQARRSWIKWKRWQEAKIQESKAKEAAAREGKASGGAGGEGGNASRAEAGGRDNPFAVDNGVLPGGGNISGREDSSSGLQLGRKIWGN